MRALLIEDETICSFIQKRLLECVGFDVTCCSIGMDGVKEALNNDYDVIVTDFELPDINGNEVAMFIDHFSDKNVPIFLVSSKDKDHVPNKFELEKFYQHPLFVEKMVKPFSKDNALYIRNYVIGHHCSQVG